MGIDRSPVCVLRSPNNSPLRRTQQRPRTTLSTSAAMRHLSAAQYTCFQEDVVRYGAMTPGVHPGQTRIDLSANLVPRTRDGSSYTISLLYYQRIYTASRCSRFATPAICLSSAKLIDVEKQSDETEAQPSSGSSSSRSNKGSNGSVSSNRSRSK